MAYINRDRNITTTPSRQSPIIHAVPSTLFEPGHMAYLFIDKPNRDDTSLEYAIDSITPNTVYLTSTKIGQNFWPFPHIIDEAFKIEIQTYLDILKFFRDDWPSVKKEANRAIKTMRSMELPIKLTETLHFTMNGSVVFQKWFSQSVFLMYRQDSHNYTSKSFIQLQRNTKSIHLHPEVMFLLAQDLGPLVETLFRADFKFEGAGGTR